MQTTELIHLLEVKLRHVKQIQRIENRLETALMTLDATPDNMVKTSRIYRNRVENYTNQINELKKSYQNL